MTDTALTRGSAAFTPDDYALLRRHVVAMKKGALAAKSTAAPSKPNDFGSTEAELRALVNEHLAAFAAEHPGPVRVMLHAHGGLVSTESALEYARTVIPWWLANGVYPIFFVWESGLWSSLKELLSGFAGRGFYPDEFFDPTFELMVRNVLGRDLWTTMKENSERSSAAGAGASVFAQLLGAFAKTHPIALHGVGHSAGSIFLAHWLPVADRAGLRFDSVSLLAPAIRADLFIEQYRDGLSNGRIGELTMFTMTERAEHDDTCMGVYRKSLLYLVSRAFEVERSSPIVGLQDSVTSVTELASTFGLNGTPGMAEVVWSPSDAGPGRRSAARAHGDFDNDAPTMESVAQRIRGAAPTAFPAPRRRSMPEDVEAVQQRSTGSGTRRALCIGIDEYVTVPLRGCVADAQRWSEAFRGLGFDEVTTLTNAQASGPAILKAMTELVTSARSGDVVAIQYSGHGTEMPDLDGDELLTPAKLPRDQALVPHGAALGEVILDDDLAEIWQAIRPGVNVTTFFDSCHSGSGIRGERSVTGEGARLRAKAVNEPVSEDDRVRVRWVDQLEPAQAAFRRLRGNPPKVTRLAPVNALLFSACRPDEAALEVHGGGVFTGAAVPLLAAADGKVTNAEFAEQVKAALVPPSGYQQVPGLWEYQSGRANARLFLAPVPVEEREAGVAAGAAAGVAASPVAVAAVAPVAESSVQRTDRTSAIAEFLRATAKLLES
ncbi:caspase family protein [Microbacteriaceae bacterium VKM Ac-2854]|nr:caspase family protein [Microbacteriaceae bacterium VKM Ac-2854]